MKINRPYRLLFVVLSIALLAGCGLPRVVVLKDPLTPEEHLNLGVAYERKGELDAAIKEYRLAAKKLPLGYLYLGNAYFLKEEFDEAERYYRKAIKKDPGNADARNNLAWLYYTEGENLDEAEALVLEAMELDPSKEEVYRDTLNNIRKLKAAPR
jgi:tetratricopeptide (TPR) repeat protein